VKPFIDQHRERLEVEPICNALQIGPSGYWREAARSRQPALCPPRRVRDAALLPEIERVWENNVRVYGADKVWKQLRRERFAVARCTVERLMRGAGLRGVIRGKSVRTTVPDAKAPCPLDLVNRQFRAERPNQLWVSDFTYVSTWQGFVYVAFVIDVFARCIVGWRVSSSMKADFVLDALEQALYARRGQRDGELVHHSEPRLAVRLDSLLRAAGRSRHRTLGGQHRRQLRQRAGRDDQRAVQGRADPSAGALQDTRGRRAGHARMGLVVQPPSTARALGIHPAGRSRGKLLAATGPSHRRNQPARGRSGVGG
jgi:transposase InsO family protein